MTRATETTTLTDRVDQLERALSALGDEVRTRRLVVTDAGGHERIVGCAAGGVAELTVGLAGCPHGTDTAVVVFANPGEDTYELGAGVGVQLWAGGDVVREVSFGRTTRPATTSEVPAGGGAQGGPAAGREVKGQRTGRPAVRCRSHANSTGLLVFLSLLRSDIPEQQD